MGCFRPMLKILISITAIASLLAGCSGFPSYRLDIQQGNAIEDAQVTQVRAGMSPQQVEFLLGTPQVRGTFVREDRWDYVYFRNPGRGSVEQRRVTVFFEAGRVSRIEDSRLEDRQAEVRASD
jgi:outer membrane protein assembly factor BamE